MPKAYWISTYHAIHDEAAVAAYGKLAGPSLTAAGGKFIVRGMPSLVKEGGKMMRTVVVEKIRHGSFLGYAGTMPPFSVEALSDADVRDLTMLFRCP